VCGVTTLRNAYVSDTWMWETRLRTSGGTGERERWNAGSRGVEGGRRESSDDSQVRGKKWFGADVGKVVLRVPLVPHGCLCLALLAEIIMHTNKGERVDFESVKKEWCTHAVQHSTRRAHQSVFIHRSNNRAIFNLRRSSPHAAKQGRPEEYMSLLRNVLKMLCLERVIHSPPEVSCKSPGKDEQQD
jgi:hypothetical protein